MALLDILLILIMTKSIAGSVVLRVLSTSEIVELKSLEWLLAADIHIMQTTESVVVSLGQPLQSL